MSWRKNIDPKLREHLESQIKESFRHRKEYGKSKDPKNAQLWVAIANLSKQVFDLNLRVKFLEKALKESLLEKGSAKKTKGKKPEDDVKKVLDAMQKF